MKFEVRAVEDFVNHVNSLFMKDTPPKQPKIFIVHGSDENTKYQLKNYIQNTLRLGEPIILHEQPSLGRTIIEKFEQVAQDVDLVFVLLTPDDAVYDSSMIGDLKRRARQNVIFELGYFFGKLQRSKGRVILLYKGALELPSDISGVIYIDISHGIESASETIRKELGGFI
jgi:predicted nucleotide-binding protein